MIGITVFQDHAGWGRNWRRSRRFAATATASHRSREPGEGRRARRSAGISLSGIDRLMLARIRRVLVDDLAAVDAVPQHPIERASAHRLAAPAPGNRPHRSVRTARETRSQPDQGGRSRPPLPCSSFSTDARMDQWCLARRQWQFRALKPACSYLQLSSAETPYPLFCRGAILQTHGWRHIATRWASGTRTRTPLPTASPVASCTKLRAATEPSLGIDHGGTSDHTRRD